MKNATSNMVRTLAIAGMIAISGVTAFAQQAVRVGVIGAANYDYVDAATQKFAPVPAHDFSKAGGFDLYAGVNGEYLFNNQIGVVLNVAYDGRRIEKEQNGSTFAPELSYISFDPGVRVNLGMPELYLTAGGTVAVKVVPTYDYTPKTAPEESEVLNADLNNVRDVAFGAWANVGYDFRLNDTHQSIGWYVAPFVGASYLFDQMKAEANPVDDTKWNTLSVRGGVQVKMQF